MRLINRLWSVSLFVLLFVLPFQLGRHFWPDASYLLGLRVSYLSPAIYLIDLAVIVFGLLSLLTTPLRVKKIAPVCFLPLLITIVFMAINWYSAQSKVIFEYATTRNIVLLVFFALVYRYPREIKKTVFLVLPLHVLLQLIVSIMQVASNSSVGGIFYWLGERSFDITTPAIARSEIFGHLFLRAYGTFSHPNSLAGFVGVIYFLILSKARLTWLDKTTLVLSILTIILTASHSAILILLFLTIDFLFRRTNLSKSLTWLSLAFFGLVTLLSSFALSNPNSDSILLRWRLIVLSGKIITTHPFFGTGIGNFLPALVGLLPQSGFYWLQPVHNIYLLALSEIGLVGFIGITFILGRQLLKARKKKDWFTNPYWGPLGFILLTGLFDHYWLTLVQNQYLFALILGLFFSFVPVTKITNQPPNNNQ